MEERRGRRSVCKGVLANQTVCSMFEGDEQEGAFIVDRKGSFTSFFLSPMNTFLAILEIEFGG